jgi:hypothetical protein
MIKEAKKDISIADFIFEISEADVEAGKVIMESLAKESERAIEEKLWGILSSEFDEENINIDVSVKADESGVEIECVEVYIYGTGLLIDPRDISSVVARYTDADCRIIEGRNE